MKLSDDQLAMLRKTAEEPVSYEGLTDADRIVLKYLASKKFVQIKSVSRSYDHDGVFQSTATPVSASITEEGKAFLATLDSEDLRNRQTRYRANASLIISGLALLIAVLTFIVK